MRIQHNIMAMNSYRNYTQNNSALSKNLEKLSSGYKINRAGDDAAGLAISEKMRAQITGLETAQSNAQSGINLVQTAEGALTEVHDMLNRMVELADQSANGTYDDGTDRQNLEKEFKALRSEIDRIADASNFNGKQLLDGSLDPESPTKAIYTSAEITDALEDTEGLTIDGVEYEFEAGVTDIADQLDAAVAKYNETADKDYVASVADGKITLTAKEGGAVATAPTITSDAGTIAALTVTKAGAATGGGKELTLQIGDTSDPFNKISVKVTDMHAKSLQIDASSIADQTSAATAVNAINAAIDKVSGTRGDLGATQNRLEHTINNLSVMTENVQDAEANIRDVDVAKEMMEYTKNNILVQSAQAMLAQANQVPQGVLQLLQ